MSDLARRIVIGKQQPASGADSARQSDSARGAESTRRNEAVVEDMTKLVEMTPETLLANLARRYELNHIYTYTGSILISVNPYKVVDGLYDIDTAKKYIGKRIGAEAPHIFAIADTTYRNLQEGSKSQSVIISGESGAGKTEATKLILRYLATRTNKSTVVEQQLLQANPVMEAFGNAKTVRNDNSSRFGKYTKVYFDASGCIGGAQITTYLLEKSRIVNQASGERNYHIFYMLCKGVTAQQRLRLRLREMSQFHYLNQSGCYDTDRDEVQDFAHLRAALHFLGLGDEQQEDLWTLVAAILHLGDLEFEPAAPSGEDAANNDGEGRTPRGNAKFQEGSAVSSREVLSTVAHLLAVEAKRLERSLTTRVVSVGSQTFTIPVPPETAADLRDALAKALYDQLFQYLVLVLNRTTYSEEVAQRVSTSFIGVLDIFGFENFDVNSFEQFCINYANEKLQQQFNQHIFKDEQDRYAKEGIDFSKVDYRDNQSCIDLIEKRGGILSLLDEECRFPGSTDRSLLEKLHRQHDTKSTDYEKSRLLGNTHFGIKHYAGTVEYLTDDFLEKNRDTLTPGLLTLIESSAFDFLADMWEERIAALASSSSNDDAQSPSSRAKPSAVSSGLMRAQTSPAIQRVGSASGSSSRRSSNTSRKTSNTVGGKFKDQLAELYLALSLTAPYYVRCIKPNSVKKSDIFDDELVATQLRYSGMMETIRIRKLGFPVVVPFRDFVVRYGCLAPCGDVDLNATDKLREACEHILNTLCVTGDMRRSDSPVGTDSVFMRDIASAYLEDIRAEVLTKFVLIVQKTLRMWQCRSVFLCYRRAAVRVQAQWRCYHDRREYLIMQEAAAVIKSRLKALVARRRFLAFRRAAIRLQTIVRMRRCRRLYKELLTHKREQERRVAEEKAAHERRLQEIRELQDAEARREREEAELNAQRERDEQSHKELKQLEEQLAQANSASQLTSVLQSRQDSVMAAGRTLDVDKPAAAFASASVASAAQVDTKKHHRRDTMLAIGENVIPTIAEVENDDPTIPDLAALLSPRMNLSKDESSNFGNATNRARIQKDLSELISYKELREFPFSEYAKLHFQRQIKGTLRKRRRTVEEMLVPSTQRIRHPLLKLASKKHSQLALSTWRSILLFVLETPEEVLSVYGMKQTSMVDRLRLVQSIVRIGLEHEELRDEIYAQLVKQSWKEMPHDIYLLYRRSWELLAYVSCCFPPSEQMLPFVASHLLGHVCTARGEPRKLHVSDVAEFALRALQKTVRLARRSTLRTYAPSLMELKALRNGEPLMIRVLLPDGSTKGSHIDSHTLVEDLYKHVAARSHLHHISSFGLYQSLDGEMRFLSMNSVFTDALGFVDSIMSQAKGRGRGTKLQFELRRRFLFDGKHSQFTDPVEKHVMLCQLTEDVRTCRLLASPDVCLELAALKLEYDVARKQRLSTDPIVLKALLPKPVLVIHPDATELLGQITAKQTHKNLTADQIADLFLQICTALPMFGSTTYLCAVKTSASSSSTLGSQILLSINSETVDLRAVNDYTQIVLSSSVADVQVVTEKKDTLLLSFPDHPQLETVSLSFDQALGASALLLGYKSHALKRSTRARALRDYNVTDPALLTFAAGDEIQILSRDDAIGWYEGKLHNRTGRFPSTFVVLISDHAPTAAASPQPADRSATAPDAAEQTSISQSEDSLPPDAAAPPVEQDESAPTANKKHSAKRLNLGSLTEKGKRKSSKKSDKKNKHKGAAASSAHKDKDEESKDEESRGEGYSEAPSRSGASRGSRAAGGRRRKARRSKLVDQFVHEYQLEPIQQPLMAVGLMAREEAASVVAFETIMMYMGDYPNLHYRTQDELAKDLITLGLRYPALNAEILAQLCTQCSPQNLKAESRRRGWVLLALVAGVLSPPARLLAKFLEALQICRDEAGPARKSYLMAVERATALAKHGVERLFVPSSRECRASALGNPIVCDIFVPGELEPISVSVHSFTTVGVVTGTVLNKLACAPGKSGRAVAFPHCYSLQCHSDVLGHRVPFSRQNLFCDLLSTLEKWGARDGRIVLTKLWWHPNAHGFEWSAADVVADPAGFRLNVSLLMMNYLDGRLPVSKSDVISLGSLLLQVELGDHTTDLEPIKKLISSVVPNRVLMSLKHKVTPDNWAEELFESLKQLPSSGGDAELVMRKFVNQASALPLYGSLQFPVEDFMGQGGEWLLCMSSSGISVHQVTPIGIAPPTRSWSYNKLQQVTCKKHIFSLVTGSMVDPERYQFRASWSAGHAEITPRVAVSMGRSAMSQPIVDSAAPTPSAVSSAASPSSDPLTQTMAADEAALVQMANVGNLVLKSGFQVPR